MASAPSPKLRLATAGDVTIVHFVDARLVSDETIQDVADQLFLLVEVEGRDQLLLNFDHVELLSSNALAMLIALDKKIKARNGRWKVCGLKPVHRQVIRVTKLDGLLEIHDEEQAALARF